MRLGGLVTGNPLWVSTGDMYRPDFKKTSSAHIPDEPHNDVTVSKEPQVAVTI